MDEAHVEHAVGLVDDEHRHGIEADLLLLDEIEQAARRGDQDVDAVAHRGDLRVLADAAENDGVAIAVMLAVNLQALADLNGELARRRQDQRARRLGGGRFAVLGETLQQRQAERGGLAGAGLGDAEQVAAGRISGMVWAWMGVGWV